MGVLLDLIRERESNEGFNGYIVLTTDNNNISFFKNRGAVTRHIKNNTRTPIFKHIYFKSESFSPHIRDYVCNGDSWIKYVCGKPQS